MHSHSKPILGKLYINTQLAGIRQSIYSLHSYIPPAQVDPHHCFLLETHKIGSTEIDNFQC